MKLQTILIIGLGAGLLAGCPAKTENTNTTNSNSNKTNAANTNTATNKNTNTATVNQSPANDKPVEKANLNGKWESEFFNKKGESYTQFTIFIKQEGETINGTYSVDDFVSGEWQGEDGNQTPFTGTLKDKTAEIKFDVNATVAGTEENVKYKEPTDGKPSTATLTIDGGKIKWKHASGEAVAETPKEIVLTKVK